VFRKLKGWWNGGDDTDSYFKDQAKRARNTFQNDPEAIHDGGGGDGAPTEEEAVYEPNIELVEFHGESTDIEWMTYNHDTNECIIQFLNHGKLDAHAHIYSYQNFPYEEFEGLRDGTGPFPRERYPHYQKTISTGQRANFYLRNDHEDDLFEYERIGAIKEK
jgi:hypothetical protein